MAERPTRSLTGSVPSAILVVIGVWCVALLLVALVHPRAGGAPLPGSGHPVPSGAAPPTAPPTPRPIPTLPGGRTRIFDHRFLVAYYGTAGTGSLGVLGDAPPDRIWPRLVRAGRPFARPGERIQPVFELIASVATRGPGPGGDFSNDIPRADVEEYIRAAHRHGALLVLDLQTGRSPFLRIAKRWAWALRDPWVGLALDPEWRMGPHVVPGEVIGHVRAAEINQVSAWLSRFTARHRLPQKLLVVHQFRVDMIRHIARVKQRPHLVLVQHVDGFGTPREKLATYHAVARPGLFRMGFKLFYHQDVRRMSARRVLAIRPRVSFVSFQ